MANPPFREFIRAEHEVLLRQWIKTVYDREKATDASLVGEMGRWIDDKKL